MQPFDVIYIHFMMLNVQFIVVLKSYRLMFRSQMKGFALCVFLSPECNTLFCVTRADYHSECELTDTLVCTRWCLLKDLKVPCVHINHESEAKILPDEMFPQQTSRIYKSVHLFLAAAMLATLFRCTSVGWWIYFLQREPGQPQNRRGNYRKG